MWHEMKTLIGECVYLVPKKSSPGCCLLIRSVQCEESRKVLHSSIMKFVGGSADLKYCNSKILKMSVIRLPVNKGIGLHCIGGQDVEWFCSAAVTICSSKETIPEPCCMSLHRGAFTECTQTSVHLTF